LWQIYGVNVAELYGQTETAGGLVTGQRGQFPRPGNIGVPPTGWEVSLSSEGEVLVRSEDLFDHYWNNPEATAEVKDSEGWLHTGDVGEWIDGSLRLIDRTRDIIITDGGKNISPTFIENIVRSSPYVSEVTVFGHSRKYLTALIEIEYDAVCQWARSNNVIYTGYTHLAQHSEVFKLIQNEIALANQQLARAEQIKLFRVLPKMLDPEEEGEPVTPTRKVKRKLMYQRFQSLVDSMYDDAEARLVASGTGEIITNAT
jgi:long-chain acyl-CoA synthetase